MSRWSFARIPPQLRPLALFALALALSLPGLGAQDIVTSHEARVAQTARQMAQTWPWDGRTLEVATLELTAEDKSKRIVALPDGFDRVIRDGAHQMAKRQHALKRALQLGGVE